MLEDALRFRKQPHLSSYFYCYCKDCLHFHSYFLMSLCNTLSHLTICHLTASEALVEWIRMCFRVHGPFQTKQEAFTEHVVMETHSGEQNSTLFLQLRPVGARWGQLCPISWWESYMCTRGSPLLHLVGSCLQVTSCGKRRRTNSTRRRKRAAATESEMKEEQSFLFGRKRKVWPMGACEQRVRV